MHKHNNCRGYTLFKLSRFQVEMWICPPHEEIEAHSHPDIESTIVVLKGRLFGTRNNKSKILTKFRPYRLHNTDIHGALVECWTCIFLNFQWWKSKPTSAAVNFQTDKS